MLEPGIVNAKLSHLLAMRGQSTRIEVYEAEQALITDRYLIGIGLALKPQPVQIEFTQVRLIRCRDNRDATRQSIYSDYPR